MAVDNAHPRAFLVGQRLQPAAARQIQWRTLSACRVDTPVDAEPAFSRLSTGLSLSVRQCACPPWDREGHDPSDIVKCCLHTKGSGETKRMALVNVFISHVSEEAELARYLQERLSEDFLNFVEVFVSSDDVSISAGDPWLASIEKALQNAAILIVLCSRLSIRRPWINFEAGAAWIRKIPIIPICHSGLTPGELPMPISTLQAVEIDKPGAFARLYDRIAKQLGCRTPRIDPNAAAEVRAIEDNFNTARLEQTASDRVSQLRNQYSPISEAIDEAHLGWTLCFIAEDQSDKLALLIDDLTRGFSDSGDGKRFASGFSYWGIGPALAWARACNDPCYLVMKKSIESFRERWSSITPHFNTSCHYASLGVGTGAKDRRILYDLGRTKQDLYFFPVDMSPEMLRIGIKDLMITEVIPRSRLLPIQLDFSIERNALELRGILSHIVGQDAILYSLLGNTLANFDDDSELLRILAGVLRPQDRLLLEIASTERVDDKAAKAAAEEYSKSPHFRQFVTSALLHYTDLPAGDNSMTFDSELEGGRSVVIKVVYRNRNAPVMMKLPDNSSIEFNSNDTIRLLLTRKYSQAGIESVISESGLRVVARRRSVHAPSVFGIDLILLASSA
jgi:uncharacterized SAM-dependent methyltransferase